MDLLFNCVITHPMPQLCSKHTSKERRYSSWKGKASRVFVSSSLLLSPIQKQPPSPPAPRPEPSPFFLLFKGCRNIIKCHSVLDSLYIKGQHSCPCKQRPTPFSTLYLLCLLSLNCSHFGNRALSGGRGLLPGPAPILHRFSH